MIDKTYYTPEEVSKRFKLSLSTIYNLIDRGELPSIKLGKCYRIPEGELIQYLRGHISRPPHRTTPTITETVTKFVDLVKNSPIKDIVSKIILYGSYVRGEEGIDSDIDLLVILKETNTNNLKAIAVLSDEAMSATDYEDFLSAMTLSDSQWERAKRLSTPFYKAVSKEGVLLWKK